MSASSRSSVDSSGYDASMDDSTKASDSGDTHNTSTSSSRVPSPPPKIPISEVEWTCRATQPTIRYDLIQEKEPLAMDVEFQKYQKAGDSKCYHRFGRVALVNTKGDTVLDSYFAYPAEKDVTKWCNSKRFNVEPPDFLFKNGAVPARKAEAQLKAAMKNHPIILHDKRGDTKAFYFEENQDAFSAANGVVVHDTQEMYSHLRSSGQPGLAYASEVVLGREIQQGGIHTPVEDAKTTMELCLLKYPYDRVAEAAKLESKKTHTQPARRGDRFVQKSIAQQKPTLGDFIKVKTTQGKAKRAKASATTTGK